jgi:hypothetical protein
VIEKNDYLLLCEDAQKEIDIYQEAAEKHVFKWEYTSGKRYDLTPYYFERNHTSRGRLSKKEERTAYGIDIDGKVWVTKCVDITDSIGSISHNEHQLIYRIYRQGKIDSIEEVIFDDGLPSQYVKFIVRNGRTLESAWHFEEYYEYEKQQLKRIIRDEYWCYEQRHYEYFLSYNDSGKLSQIKDKKEKIVFLDISRSQAMTLREEVKIGLIKESIKVLKAICEKAGKEYICYLGIYLHDEPEAVCDPIFHPAIEKIRLEQMKVDNNFDSIWNTGEHPVDNQQTIQNKELIGKFKLLVDYWEMKNNWWKEAKKLWYEVTQQLNREDWGKYPLLTDDFVFFVDEEGLDIKKLAQSMPPEKIDLLRARGLISI